mgnify:FL=1
MNTTSYSHARTSLAALCKEVSDTREPVIIRRRNAEDVALIAASELTGLQETAHLLRSPKNAQRLLTALQRALTQEFANSTVDEIRTEAGLAKEDQTKR